MGPETKEPSISNSCLMLKKSLPEITIKIIKRRVKNFPEEYILGHNCWHRFAPSRDIDDLMRLSERDIWYPMCQAVET